MMYHHFKKQTQMKKQILMTAIAGLACLAACTQLEREAENDAQMREIRFLALQRVNTTSPVDGTVFPDGYYLKVSAFRNLGAHAGDADQAATYFTAVTFKKNETLWKEAKYWPLDGTLDFLAYGSAGLKDGSKGILPIANWGEGGNAAKKVVLTVPDNSGKFDDILYGASNDQTCIANGNPLVLNHAETVVCFSAKANVAYDASTNKGVTIESITIDDAYYGGKLTISNPAAGGGSGTLTASWSELSHQKTHVAARVYGDAPCESREAELSGLNLTTTAATFNDKHFGEAYVILPPQAATSFTITYTLHNGRDGDGTPANNQMQYVYTCSGSWEQATKNLYTIDITLNEITITPSVGDWAPGTPVAVQI